MKKNPTVATYKDGVISRWHNKRITVVQLKDRPGVMVQIVKFDKADMLVTDPPCRYKKKRGIHTTTFAISAEAASALHRTLCEFIKAGLNKHEIE